MVSWRRRFCLFAAAQLAISQRCSSCDANSKRAARCGAAVPLFYMAPPHTASTYVRDAVRELLGARTGCCDAATCSAIPSGAPAVALLYLQRSHDSFAWLERARERAPGATVAITSLREPAAWLRSLYSRTAVRCASGAGDDDDRDHAARGRFHAPPDAPPPPMREWLDARCGSSFAHPARARACLRAARAAFAHRSPWAWNAMTRLLAGNYSGGADDGVRDTTIAGLWGAPFGFTPPPRARHGFWAELERHEYKPKTLCAWRTGHARGNGDHAARARADRGLLAIAMTRLREEFAAFTIAEESTLRLSLLRAALCAKPTRVRGNRSLTTAPEKASDEAHDDEHGAAALAREYSPFDVELYQYARALLHARKAKGIGDSGGRCTVPVSCPGSPAREGGGRGFAACPRG